MMEFNVVDVSDTKKEIEIWDNPQDSERKKQAIRKERRSDIDKRFKSGNVPMRLRGFRKGHISNKMLEDLYGGKTTFYVGYFDELFREAISKSGLNVVNTLSLKDNDVISFGAGKETRFKIQVEIQPPIECPDYTGLVLPWEDVSATDEEIEKQIELMLRNHRTFQEEEKFVAGKEDALKISFSGKCVLADGKTKEVEPAKDLLIVLGEKDYIENATSFISFFERQLVGLAKGVSHVKFVMPTNAQSEDLRGAEVDLDVEVLAIGKMVEPELNDEIAKKTSNGNASTVEELGVIVANAITNRKKQRYNENLDESIYAELLKRTGEFPVAEGIVQQEAESITVRHLDSIRGPKSIETLLKEKGVKFADIVDGNKKVAVNSIRRRLIFNAIAEKAEIVIDDEVIKEEIETNDAYARRKGKEVTRPTVNQLKEALTAAGRFASFEEDLRLKLVTKLIKKNATFKGGQ